MIGLKSRISFVLLRSKVNLSVVILDPLLFARCSQPEVERRDGLELLIIFNEK